MNRELKKIFLMCAWSVVIAACQANTFSSDSGKSTAGGKTPVVQPTPVPGTSSTPLFDSSKNWGGFYRPYIDGVCAVPNPVTGGCSCPAGAKSFQYNKFRGLPTDGYYLHPGNPDKTKPHGIEGFYCTQDPALGVPEESFKGAYRIHAGGTCDFPNPFTGGCSCSAGTLDTIITKFDAGSYPEYGINAMEVHACLDPVKAGPITAGFYRSMGDGSCDRPNTYTKSCKCPDGFKANLIDEFTDGEKRFFAPSFSMTLFQCVKKQN